MHSDSTHFKRSMVCCIPHMNVVNHMVLYRSLSFRPTNRGLRDRYILTETVEEPQHRSAAADEQSQRIQLSAVCSLGPPSEAHLQFDLLMPDRIPLALRHEELNVEGITLKTISI